MRLWPWASVGGLVLLAGCDGSGSDRPHCNAGNPCGDGDADADADGDADADADGDGDLDCPVDADRDGFIDARCPSGNDCRDDDAASHPGSAEVCNGIDDDCVEGVDQGMLVDGTDVVLESDGVAKLIALAAGATGFGLLTLDVGDVYCRGDRALNFFELRPDGTVASGPVLVSATPECRYEHTLSVASVPTGWLVAWADAPPPLGPSPGLDGVVQVASVSGATVTGPVEIGDREARGEFTPVIAVGPDNALVVWNRDQVDLAFVLIDPTDLAVLAEGALGRAPAIGGRPSAVWTGELFLVASEIDADKTSVFPVNADGTTGTPREMGHNYWDAPVLAWDGSTAGFSQLDNGEQQYHRLGARGEGGFGDPVAIDAGGKAQRMAGWGGSLALTATIGGEDVNLRGTFHFWNLSPDGVVSNALTPDDAGSVGAGDPWAVPNVDAGSWALAWIDDDHDVRIDFVGCPD